MIVEEFVSVFCAIRIDVIGSTPIAIMASGV